MKRVLLTSGLIIAGTASCYAKQPSWKSIFEGSGGAIYVDSSNISRNGNKVSVWWLSDSKVERTSFDYDHRPFKYRSSVFLYDIDCGTPPSYVIRIIKMYSGQMAQGDLVDRTAISERDLRSEIIEPGTPHDELNDALKDYVCQ
jgi:hypothetical protein